MVRTSLIQARRAKGWTQQEVADRVGIKKPMVCLIEKGHKNPSLDLANRLEDLFGIPQRILLAQDEQ